MAAMSNYLENKVIDWFFRAQTFTPPAGLHVGLLTSAPSDTGGGTEVSGNAYARQNLAPSLTNWAGTQGAGSTSTSSGTNGTTTSSGPSVRNPRVSVFADVIEDLERVQHDLRPHLTTIRQLLRDDPALGEANSAEYRQAQHTYNHVLFFINLKIYLIIKLLEVISTGFMMNLYKFINESDYYLINMIIIN